MKNVVQEPPKTKKKSIDVSFIAVENSLKFVLFCPQNMADFSEVMKLRIHIYEFLLLEGYGRILKLWKSLQALTRLYELQCLKSVRF